MKYSALLLLPLISAWCLASELIVVPPNIQIGSGFNTLGGLYHSGKPKAICVNNQNLIESIGNLKGSTIRANLRFIKSHESLSEIFDSALTSTVGLVKKDIFNTSINGHIKYRSDEVADYNYSLAFLTISKEYHPLNLTKFELNQGILETFSHRPQNFFDVCGDEFVSSITVGATVHALITCTSSEYDRKVRLDKYLSLKAGYQGASMTGDLQTTLDTVFKLSDDSCGLQVVARGGKGNPISTNKDHFLETAITYISNAAISDGVVLKIDTSSYNNIVDKDFRDKVLSETDLELKTQRNYIRKLRSSIEFWYSQASRLNPVQACDWQKLSDIHRIIDRHKKDIERCAKSPYNSTACMPEKRIFDHIPEIGINFLKSFK